MEYSNGRPDPSIKEIEEALRKARFGESPVESFLSRRSRTKMLHAQLAKINDAQTKAVFMTGYRAGKEDGIFYARAIGAFAGLVLLALMWGGYLT